MATCGQGDGRTRAEWPHSQHLLSVYTDIVLKGPAVLQRGRRRFRFRRLAGRVSIDSPSSRAGRDGAELGATSSLASTSARGPQCTAAASTAAGAMPVALLTNTRCTGRSGDAASSRRCTAPTLI
mmetsp:Transcript_53575/g.106614  ORF Transcript_53575/g.106614 Transcript_53575/m.106614 type:complete len:125 (-) Transcript_53575:145-519(-)